MRAPTRRPCCARPAAPAGIGPLDFYGKGGAFYPSYGGVALETQMWPNSINTPNFPDAVLRPGKQYSHQLSYRFYTG